MKNQLKQLYKVDPNQLFELKTKFIKELSSGIEYLTGPYSSIISVLVPGNKKAKQIENQLKEGGVFAKAILQPTVAEGTERLRICLHNFNKEADVIKLAKILNQSI